MALSTLTGACWKALRRSIPGFQEIPEQDVILVGVRDLEPYQRDRLERSRVRALFGEMVGCDSLDVVLEPALHELGATTRTVYIHVGLDVLDPSEGRANEYAAPGGMSLVELERAIRLVGIRFDIAGAAMTAYDPGCDSTGQLATAAVRVATAIREAAG
jgi:arginase